MALSFFQIKRWYLMLRGKSILHVNQDMGKYFEFNKISGYYNNLTEKVLKAPELLDNNELPVLDLENGQTTYFPVAIFQYGLGAYDLYFQTNDNKYLRKFLQCVDWSYGHQDELGRWNNFSHYSPEHPYGAMAQGEGASLLIRAYIQTGEEKYLDAAKKAIDFMLLPLDEGGTTKYEGDDAYLMEYTFLEMVLNGSIFAWWGLYDFVIATNDGTIYKQALQRTLGTIVKILPKFRLSYWSLYSLDGLIASPFYHKLHIAQMQAMFLLTKEQIFNDYAIRWEKQSNNALYKALAFTKKAIQKILE
jgi:hypothetical protein